MKIFVHVFGMVVVIQEMKVKVCRLVAQTHSTHIKIVIESTEGICLETGSRFCTKGILLS
jgi:hypothetical protein